MLQSSKHDSLKHGSLKYGGRPREWWLAVRSQNAFERALFMSLCVLVVFGAVVPIAIRYERGIVAAALAAMICLGGSVSALLLAEVFRGRQVYVGVLVGMACRMVPPLSLVIALMIRPGALLQAGIGYYLVVFYLVTLALETLLTLPVENGSGAA